MTWSISASGPKDDVLNKINAAHAPTRAAEVTAFRAAQDLCRAQLESIATDTATVMASGSDSQCSVLVHSKAKAEPVEAAKGETDTSKTRQKAAATEHTAAKTGELAAPSTSDAKPADDQRRRRKDES